MTTIKCSNCQKEIRARAKVCPFCCTPVREMTCEKNGPAAAENAEAKVPMVEAKKAKETKKMQETKKTQETKKEIKAYISVTDEYGIQAVQVQSPPYCEEGGAGEKEGGFYSETTDPQVLKNAARSNVPEAMYLMGVCHYYGENSFEEDEDAAKEWLERAIEAGCEGAAEKYREWFGDDGALPDPLSKQSDQQARRVSEFTICVAGVTFEGRQEVVRRLRIGEPICLIPEPSNSYDPCAVQVLTQNKEQVGYIPKGLNKEIFCNLMQKRGHYEAHVSLITGGGDFNYGCRMDVEYRC